ncbi:permease prefix domain 1-containing protein [Roseburia hominis]
MNRRSYLNALLGQIRCKRAWPMIEEELQGHIDEQKRDFMAAGMSEQEAEAAAVLEMGDPFEVGRQLDKIHRPRLPYPLIGFIIGLSSIGVALQIAINKLIEMGDGFGLYGRYVQDMFAGMGIGIILMVMICRMDYRVLGKYAMRLWAVLNGVIVLQVIAGMFMGRTLYLRMNVVSCMLILSFAGVIYHYKDKGIKGLFKCVGWYIIAIFLLLPGLRWSFNYIALFYVTGAILIFVASVKKWFGGNRAKQTMITVGMIVGVTAVMALIGIGIYYHYLVQYQQDRVIAAMQLSGDVPFNIEEMLKRMSLVMNDSANVMILDEDAMTLTSIRSDYLFTFVFKCLGSWQGILITVLVAAFLVLLCVLVHKQKNPLGYILSLAALLMVGIQSLLYFGINLGYLPSTAIAMPFFTGGKTNMLITYICMGLLLSVYRNQNLIPEN